MPRHIVKALQRHPSTPKTPAICRSLIGKQTQVLMPHGPCFTFPAVPGPLILNDGPALQAQLAWNGFVYLDGAMWLYGGLATAGYMACLAGPGGYMQLFMAAVLGFPWVEQPPVSWKPSTNTYVYRSTGTATPPGTLYTVVPF